MTAPRLHKRYWPDGSWAWSVTVAGQRVGYVTRVGRVWRARLVDGTTLPAEFNTRGEGVGALIVMQEVAA